MTRRAPLDVTGRPTSATEFAQAIRVVDRSQIVPALIPYVEAQVGRPCTFTLRGLLVVMVINGARRHHVAHLVELARIVNGLTESQRTTLGFTKHDPAQTYDRVDRLYLRLCRVLEAEHLGCVAGLLELLDHTWFDDTLARAAISPDMLISSSQAVDGTDVETWGVLHGQVVDDDVANELAEERDATSQSEKHPKVRPRAKVLGVGSDGRNIYTADRDARASHRSATNSRAAGKYVGHELHLGVQTRDVKWTNRIDKVTLSGEVPEVITLVSLVPAGSHRANAVAGQLIKAKQAGVAIDDVVVDPGYSILSPETMHDRLAAEAIHTTFQLTKYQRGQRPFGGDAYLIDGQLYSRLLPSDLLDLPMPPRGAPESVKIGYESAFNRRASWRMVPHTRPDADGATRWRCPFCGGLIRSRQFPKTMRGSSRKPLVHVPDEVTGCCSGSFTVMPDALRLWQRIPYGTTAWRKSMGRRQAAESANSGLKGGFVDLSRGFFRVLGTTKIAVLLAFTIVGYNLDRVRSFRAKHRIQDPDDPIDYPPRPMTRKRRLTGTWADLIDAMSQGPPPPSKLEST